MKISTLALLTLSVSLAACATKVRIPEVALDAPVFAKAEPEPVSKFETSVVTVPEPLPLPGQLKPLPQKAELGKGSTAPDKPPEDRIAAANAAAKIEPGKDSTINAMQVYPFTQGALYQLYAAVNQVSDIALEPGETLLSVSSGDTVRWVIGDTQSGAGASARTHILVKPTAADLATNLVIATDRRTYHLELTSTEKTYIASLSWTYPLSELVIRKRQAEARAEAREAVIDTGIALDSIRFRYRIEGDAPWRPAQVFDDGNKVYIQFPSTLRQGEARPCSSPAPTASRRSSITASRARPISSTGCSPPPNCATAKTHSGLCGSLGRMRNGARSGNDRQRGSSTAPEKVDPDSVELRVKPRPVTRINRRVVIGGVALGVTAIAGLVILALRPIVWTAQGPRELLNTETKPYAEGLEGLPKRYDAVRPPERVEEIAPAGGDRDQASQDAAARSPLLDQELQDQLRLARQARSAPVFFQIKGQTSVRRESSPSSAPSDPTRDAFTALQADLQSLAPSTPLEAGVTGDTAQTAKLAFLNAKPDASIYNAHSLQKPASPYQLIAGTIISASLITGLNSDLPGFVIAQVTEPVYDTVSGKHLLIPQGARLVGKYDARVSFGQNRALIVWQRIIRPDGSSIVIENLPATDQSGYAGLSDEVDNHTWQLIKGIALATLLNVGSELSFGDDESDLVKALRQGFGQTTNRAASQIVERQLNVQPTIKVRPGWPLRVIVQKDLVLEPYKQR